MGRKHASSTANRVSRTYEDAQKENLSRHAHDERESVLKQPQLDSISLPQQYDATDDINDIDRRLNALQHFLEAAKAPR